MVLGCSDKDDTSQTDSSPPISPSACDPALEETGSPIVAFDSNPPKNLLVISIDTLRRDRIGRYQSDNLTPFFDGILDQSVALDDFRVCANWTLPGVTCAMVGQSTLEIGVEPMYADQENSPEYLDDELETLTTWLANTGFSTALVTTSKLFSDDRPVGNDFATVRYNGDVPAWWVVEEGVEMATTLKQSESPWYLHLHFRDPHSPFAPPLEYQGALADADLGDLDPRTTEGIAAIARGWSDLSGPELASVMANTNALYDGEVRYLDDQLSILWTALTEMGALDDTLVVFWSDHGEQFFEHGAFQHGKSLHMGEANGIGMFWAANLDAVAWSAPTEQKDIAPTILHALNIDIPAQITGVPVGTALSDRVRISTTTRNQTIPIHSIERYGHRMLYDWTGDKKYYFIPNDPSEDVNLYDANDPNVVCLWELLSPAIELVDAARAGISPQSPHP